MTTTLRTPITPTRVINFATILPLFTPAAALTAPRRRLPDVRVARSRPTRPARVQKMESATRTVPRVTGSLSNAAGLSRLQTIGAADLALPLGFSRFTNVATMKKLLRADRSDILLRKVGDAWEICPDSMRVDLADDTVEFRLGPVQIYS
jgi:hypothetical protein